MIRYDANIIHQFAQKLYTQADLTILLFTIGGVAVGGGLGSLISNEAALVGLVVAGAIAFFIGQARAFQLKLQAQVALCQVQIEENTRLVSGVEVVKAGPVKSQSSSTSGSFRWVEPTASRPVTRSTSPQVSVTEQEKQFLNLFAQELSIEEISSRLVLSEERVIMLQVQLRQKLGVHTNTDMIQKAKERGYLQTDQT